MPTTGSHGTAGSSPMTRASRWVLGAAIAGSALAVGTVHTVTLCVVTGVLAVAAVMAWWGAEPMKARSAATMLLFTGIGLTAYTALQCVPMPIGWLAVIAPHNADVWSRALSPLHEPGPSWAPISLDPTATRVEVLKGVAYLLAFVTGLGVARRREGVAFLGAAIVVTGVALAAAAVLHPAFRAHTLFGVYTPGPGIQERHVAPLMDPNNLAGYLNLALCLSFAATLAPQPHVLRPISGAMALLLGATQLWVASRGGVATMVLGAFIVVGIAYLTRSRQSRTAMALGLGTGLAMVVGTALIVVSGSDEASTELLDADISKVKMVAATFRGLPSMLFFGCGRGAFESVFPAFRSESGYVTFACPENVVAQWVVEWGLPVGIAGLVAIAFALRPNVVLARSTTAGGAWAGVVALAVQNLGDLGTEIPGLALAGVVCVAMVTAGSSGSEATWRVEHWARRPRLLALGAAAVVVAALALQISSWGRELHDDQDAMRHAVIHRVPASDVRAMARGAMLRHPAEPYLPFVVALREGEGGGNPIPWIGATLERARVFGPAHLALARALRKRSPSQARLEYRLAMEQAPNLVGEVMGEAPRVVGSYSDATELVPEGNAGVTVMELLEPAIRARLPATRVLLDIDMVARAPTAYEPTQRFAVDAVDDLEAGDGAPWCQGSGRAACLSDALSKSRRLEELGPNRCEGYVLHTRARLAAGDAAGAIEELERAADQVADRVPCLKEVVALARKAGKTASAEAALEKIITAGCGDATECAQNLLWVARVYEGAGRPHDALALCKRALGKRPDDALLGHIAALAAGEGLHAEAAEDYEQLARRHPDNAEWRRSAVSEHDAAMRAAQRL